MSSGTPWKGPADRCASCDGGRRHRGALRRQHAGGDRRGQSPDRADPPGLPSVTIVPFYDRSELIQRAIGTLRTTVIEEIVLVTLGHVVFLLHFRSVLIVTLPLPLVVLAAFLGMHFGGLSSNIMSLAGMAIAIGVLVDAGIVVTENAFRHIEQHRVDVKDSPAVHAHYRSEGRARREHPDCRAAERRAHADSRAGGSRGQGRARRHVDGSVASPAGAQIPLGELARIEAQRGPAMIASENGLVVATVLLNVQGRDVGGFISDARARSRTACGSRPATTWHGAGSPKTRSTPVPGCCWRCPTEKAGPSGNCRISGS
jgi:hypothetical protein